MTSNFDLVADVGGTNTRVALASSGRLIGETIQRFKNSENESLSSILKDYCGTQTTGAIRYACVAVAGPVKNGIGQLTNLDWGIDEANLIESSNATSGIVINDLQAQGHGISGLAQDVLKPIILGTKKSGTTKLVVNLGTGFNSVPVYQSAQGTMVPASESGHIDLPVQSDEDRSFQEFAERKYGFASVEEALSGRGLENLFAWCAETANRPETASAKDIVERCESDPTAKDAVTHLVRFLGVVVGNLALTHLPFGGIYLVGGLARGLSQQITSNEFAEAFAAKGRFKDFMSEFTVDLVEDDYAALTGCAQRLLLHA